MVSVALRAPDCPQKRLQTVPVCSQISWGRKNVWVVDVLMHERYRRGEKGILLTRAANWFPLLVR